MAEQQAKPQQTQEKSEFFDKVVRDYRIIKPIGEGKFSVVFKAQKLSDNVQVALKILKLIRQAAARQQFLEERRVWTYVWQIASALRHMFQVRIMHRDLKPANIFIDIQDNLKLGDLGLGRDFTSQTMEAYSRVGTPLYMSPEVLQGSGYDFKSDVWSLGCIAYELCALKSPFKDETKKMSLYDLFTKINQGVYTPLSASRYSSELRYLIDSMLRVDPQERVDINDVVIYCEKQIATLNKSDQNSNGTGKKVNRMDPILIMDDIIEKLHLLDYSTKFCAEKQRKPISRTYFAIKQDSEPTDLKVRNFVEISYWLMSLCYEGQDEVNISTNSANSQKPGSKNGRKDPRNAKRTPSATTPQKKDNPFKINFDKFKSESEAVDQLLQDVKKFKVSLPEHFSSKQNTYASDDEDEIIQGSDIVTSSHMPVTDQNQVGSKDLTDIALVQKNKRRLFFQQLNDEEQSEDDFHSQFKALMTESLKGRTTDLFKSGALNARTGSTAASENTQLLTKTTIQYKSNFQELATITQEIMTTNIDPVEWQKEVNRVKDQLSYKIFEGKNNFSNESDDVYNRRKQILQDAIVFQDNKVASANDLKQLAGRTDNKLQLLEEMEQQLAVLEDNILQKLSNEDGEMKIRNMKSNLSELRKQIDSMHQREGILRIALEKQIQISYLLSKEKKKSYEKRKKQNTLRITDRDAMQKAKIQMIQEEPLIEDDEEYFEKIHRKVKKSKKSMDLLGTDLAVTDKLKKKVDDDEEYSWDSDFD
ncbi:-related protein kinase 6 [Stylonychia lemnae]|uniref:non-specific serine/threonine protein kinase n=1 Tax=Stylonychia lemnae TaxID=5949 RepID=A0A078ATW3_STYLE|nr:-related protein kinase 6 [Stylonychia lemnae]|eukprot:CDW85386.1 -related protein kinase 6 [Stylonychia lemnae]